jgi:hypothetical protein
VWQIQLLFNKCRGLFFPGVKWPGIKVNHKPPAIAEVKYEWGCTSTPPYAFMAWTGTALPLFPIAPSDGTVSLPFGVVSAAHLIRLYMANRLRILHTAQVT